jgi:hypothetical protein
MQEMKWTRCADVKDKERRKKEEKGEVKTLQSHGISH